MRIGVAFDEGPNEDGAMASQALAPLGDVVPIPVGDRLADLLRATRPDIVLNLARGSGSPERRLQVPASLEQLAIPFCGSGSATHSACVERPRLKAALAARGIPTASASVVTASK
jgi:D-alanine-D-alanine ligase-like ATP-grasp enzyme